MSQENILQNQVKTTSRLGLLFRQKVKLIKNILAFAIKEKQAEKQGIEKGSTQNKLCDILKLESKTYKEGQYIFENIKRLAFIQKFFGENLEDENMAIQLCRQMSYEEFDIGVPVMKQGDESNDKLYVIIEGQVGIVIAKDTNVFKKDDKNTKNQANTNKKSEQEDTLDQVIEKYGTKVNELSKGDGFGEKALLLSPQEAKRNASIVALKKTICIVVLRKDFLRIQENFNRENQLKEQLLIQQMPFLKNITSSSTKEGLMLYFKNQSASRGKYLTQESKQGELIYILQSGRVTVEKKFLNENNIYYSDYKTLKITEISEPTFIGEEILFSGSEIQEQLNAGFNNKKSKYNGNKDHNSNRIIESNATETEENIQDCYQYTIKVDSLLCKFFVISKNFFLNKFPKEILKDIKEKYIQKERARQTLIQINQSKIQSFPHDLVYFQSKNSKFQKK